MKRGRPSKLKFSVRQQRLGESLYNVTSQNLRKLTDFILCLRYCMNTLNVNLSRRQPVCVHVWAFKAQWYVYVWPNLNWLHMLYLCISDYCPSKLQLLPLRSSVRNGDEEFTVKYGLRFWNICYNKFLLQYFRPKATFVVTQPPNYKIRQTQYAVKKINFYKSKNSPPFAFLLHFLEFCPASSLSSPEAWAGRVPWTFRDVHPPPINVVTLTISHTYFLLRASHIEWNAF